MCLGKPFGTLIVLEDKEMHSCPKEYHVIFITFQRNMELKIVVSIQFIMTLDFIAMQAFSPGKSHAVLS